MKPEHYRGLETRSRGSTHGRTPSQRPPPPPPPPGPSTRCASAAAQAARLAGCARRSRPPVESGSTSTHIRKHTQTHTHKHRRGGAGSVEPARSAHTHTDAGRETHGEERQKMEGGGSFGAGRTGSSVDPIAFAKQPQTILRVLTWVRASLTVYSPFHLLRCRC